MNGAHLWGRGCYGQRWLCRASGSDSVLRLQPVIVFTCYKLSEDTSSLLNVCVTKSCLVPHMKYMAGSVVSPMVSQHTMGLQGPLCSSSTAIRDSCWSGAYTQQALSSASLPPVSAIMTPPPASHVSKYPVFSFSVCCSFLLAHPSFHRVGLQGWAITERSLSSHSRGSSDRCQQCVAPG